MTKAFLFNKVLTHQGALLADEISPETIGIEREDFIIYRLVQNDIAEWDQRSELPKDYGKELISVQKKTIRPYVYYCDSISWDDSGLDSLDSDTADNTWSTRDRRGVGTKDNPFRNINHALEVLNCFVNRYAQCGECQNFILLKISGIVDYSICSYYLNQRSCYDCAGVLFFDFSEAVIDFSNKYDKELIYLSNTAIYNLSCDLGVGDNSLEGEICDNNINIAKYIRCNIAGWRININGDAWDCNFNLSIPTLGATCEKCANCSFECPNGAGVVAQVSSKCIFTINIIGGITVLNGYKNTIYVSGSSDFTRQDSHIYFSEKAYSCFIYFVDASAKNIGNLSIFKGKTVDGLYAGELYNCIATGNIETAVNVKIFDLVKRVINCEVSIQSTHRLNGSVGSIINSQINVTINHCDERGNGIVCYEICENTDINLTFHSSENLYYAYDQFYGLYSTSSELTISDSNVNVIVDCPNTDIVDNVCAIYTEGAIINNTNATVSITTKHRAMGCGFGGDGNTYISCSGNRVCWQSDEDINGENGIGGNGDLCDDFKCSL